MIFLHRNQTRLQLANALSTAINVPLDPAVRDFLVATEVECILTLMVCALMIYKKQSLGKSWIMTRRNSPHGQFYVANAVFVLLIGVAAYLIAWNTTALAAATFSFANISTLQWMWIVPLPWLPLIVGAYISLHGFAIGCSPRSPLASINHRDEASRLEWYYLPVVKSVLVANLMLIVPCVLFSASTVALTIASAHAYYSARHFAKHHLPADVLGQMADHFASKASKLPDPQVIASDELIWIARNVAARYMEVYRYMYINLFVFAGVALVLLLLPTYLYALPNIMSLIDHACARYPEPIPESCNSFYRKIWFMLTKGKPSAGGSSKDVNLSRWKMTILAVSYGVTMCISVPAFAWIPIYIVCDGWQRIPTGNVVPTFTGSLSAVSLATIVSCTLIAGFCTAATIDPVFRAAIGLNLRRTKLPADIKIEFEKVSRFSIVRRFSNVERSGFKVNRLPPAKVKPLTLAFKPSSCSFGSSSKQSPLLGSMSPTSPTFGSMSPMSPTFGSMSPMSPTFGSTSPISPTVGSMPKHSPTTMDFPNHTADDVEVGFRHMVNIDEIQDDKQVEVTVSQRIPSYPSRPFLDP